jgi:hypothetical protein
MAAENDNSTRTRSGLSAWFAASTVSAAIVLSIELNRHHYAAHKVGARVAAAILIWLALGVIFRFFVFLAMRVRRQSPQDVR